jgi:hypothetical protein
MSRSTRSKGTEETSRFAWPERHCLFPSTRQAQKCRQPPTGASLLDLRNYAASIREEWVLRWARRVLRFAKCRVSTASHAEVATELRDTAPRTAAPALGLRFFPVLRGGNFKRTLDGILCRIRHEPMLARPYCIFPLSVDVDGGIGGHPSAARAADLGAEVAPVLFRRIRTADIGSASGLVRGGALLKAGEPLAIGGDLARSIDGGHVGVSFLGTSEDGLATGLGAAQGWGAEQGRASWNRRRLRRVGLDQRGGPR